MPVQPNTGAETPTQPMRSAGSGFAPLRLPLFRDRWIASTVSNVGTWMQDTAGTWLMAVLTTSPLLIALMQTAASLPVLLLGLLAGATADIYERRRLLLFWQSWMLVSVAVLAVLTFVGVVSPFTLLLFTCLLNVGSAMNNPAWQAIVPELVPREEIPNAVTLNAVSNNIARAVGPAMGGLIVAAFTKASTGAGWVFAFNSVSYAGVIWILWKWKRTPLFKSALPAERIFGSVRTGLRYLRHSPSLQAPLLRAFLFTFFVSAMWALLAVVARQDMHQGALGYGILNGSLGAGAILGATSLAYVRRHVSTQVLLASTLSYYVVLLVVLALVKSPAIIIAALLVGGFAWTSTMSTINVAVQLSVPGWVQARALGAYLMTFQGGLALGSALWGLLAEHTSTKTSLLCAAGGMLLTAPLAMRTRLLEGEAPDLTPYKWKRPVPQFPQTPEPEAGPVRISVDYTIPEEHYVEFTHAVHELEGVRLRGGAIRWGIYRDAANPEHMNETFVMESWLDYLRSRERMTAADHTVRARVVALHAGPELPVVSHQIFVREVTPELQEKTAG